jgi:RNA polymerase sigma factor (sigma-70 family)
MQTAKSDTALLASRHGCDFGVFYQRHVQAVTSYVASRGFAPDVTFDLVAETFARALQHRQSYVESRGPAVAWLIGIARHQIADAARRGRVDAAARRRLGTKPIWLDDEQLAAIEDRGAIDIRAALAVLPEDERYALVRRIVNEEPYPIIATRVGCSEQVIRKRVSRGLAHLRRNLEGQQP